jgi:hypothetical protein
MEEVPEKTEKTLRSFKRRMMGGPGMDMCGS